MRIGVVSDTHNNLKNVERIIELFNAAAVDHVVHTGDITQPATMALFANLDAPLSGVYGNNDEGELERLVPVAEEHGFEFVMPPLRFAAAGHEVMVVHDPLEFDGTEAAARLALHGHTHLYREERRADWLMFNPGECAGHMNGLNTVGVVDIATLHIELLKF